MTSSIITLSVVVLGLTVVLIALLRAFRSIRAEICLRSTLQAQPLLRHSIRMAAMSGSEEEVTLACADLLAVSLQLPRQVCLTVCRDLKKQDSMSNIREYICRVTTPI